jgi:hypothetical protein
MLRGDIARLRGGPPENRTPVYSLSLPGACRSVNKGIGTAE